MMYKASEFDTFIPIVQEIAISYIYIIYVNQFHPISALCQGLQNRTTNLFDASISNSRGPLLDAFIFSGASFQLEIDAQPQLPIDRQLRCLRSMARVSP